MGCTGVEYDSKQGQKENRVEPPFCCISEPSEYRNGRCNFAMTVGPLRGFTLEVLESGGVLTKVERRVL